MLRRIRAKLILLTVGSTLVSILLISLIMNITIFQRYNRYLEHEQTRSHEEIVDLAVKSYKLNNGWKHNVASYFDFSPLIHNYDIEIRNTEGEIVYSHKLESSIITTHNEMMKQMGHSMMGGYHSGKVIDDTSYVSRKYDLEIDTQKIGTIEIASIGPYLISQRDIEFTKGINTSIVLAALISIIVAILFSVYFSKILSDPVVKITQAANDMRNGVLDIQVNISDNTVELQELVDSINHLAKSLNHQQALRSRLTADISHELRTPLTILQSYIEAINDGVWEPTPEKLNIISKEVNRLIKLVEELKYLADIENHQLVLDTKEINLSTILQEVLYSFKYEFLMKGIDLQANIEENRIINGDQDKLKQVFINLLANALKFTSEGGIAEVRLSTNKENIVIYVKDTGIGIGEEDVPYIFERFYRSDISRNRKSGGTGIGLTIAKTIVEAHNGKIIVESKAGEGTCFVISFPKSNN